MKFTYRSGLWTTGPDPEPPPLATVLEVSGAVLAGTVDDRSRQIQITLTDVDRADWLWRLVGATGHAAVVAALGVEGTVDHVEIDSAAIDPDTADTLRRLALGHWLRRWWPASRRDGIADLDAAVLDGELALLTAAAHEFFDDDSFDADVAGLLRPHGSRLNSLLNHHDSRVAGLARSCAELAEDSGVALGGLLEPAGRRDDYALAAGPGDGAGADVAIADGRSSVPWSAVPPGVFDAAEDTIRWRVAADGDHVGVAVRTDVWGAGSPAGLAVRLRSGAVNGTGVLDGAGAATIGLFDGDRPLNPDAAWDHDWSDASVTVGTEVPEDRPARERVRAFARARLTTPGDDAFLAELLAAAADY
ncbi:hypothetical protein MJO55_13190 [Mycolicibacterium rufum]|uniref:Uncharacterized protein n=1 Tax=Mycolicibacterium rufum TaxID=318424 RepID=A0ABY3UQC4_9MYCO|nr:hypothetical protein [Mycolicibacterium rufum]KGI68233.1 hypothetical protein EU78_13250 [Mycolicibacterium rufum]ULP39273.1 hypothetical protein MJO55_13190 [Mycolicibacterium rufum]